MDYTSVNLLADHVQSVRIIRHLSWVRQGGWCGGLRDSGASVGTLIPGFALSACWPLPPRLPIEAPGERFNPGTPTAVPFPLVR
jgi:hypothetical protein